MNDSSKKRLLRTFPDSFMAPWLVSRRAFICMLGATGVVFAQKRTAPLAKDVTGFLNDNNPVDLVPRLSPLPEAVVSVAQPCLDLNGTWRFNPDPRPQSFDVLNTLCTGWKATSIAATPSGGAVEITVTGHYNEAAGSYTMRIDGDGGATIGYRFTYAADEKIAARQIGMVLYAPRTCDTLTWERKAQWSVYPEDHVGRPEGTAKALPDPSLVAKAGSWMEVAYREKPAWPWSMDANLLGTRDFRATRRNILRVSLKDSAGNGATILSDGTQHTRSFLDGNRIGLLVACYSGPALNTSWLHGLYEISGIEPMPLQAGAELKDVVRLSLADAFGNTSVTEPRSHGV